MTTDAPTAIEQLAMLLTEVRLDCGHVRGADDEVLSHKDVYRETLATIQGAIDERIAAALGNARGRG